MDEHINYFVGLDVHKDTISVSVCEVGREASRFLGAIRHDVAGLIKLLRKVGPAPDQLLAYEAGPTGFGLQRRLTQAGYRCEVIAPSLMPQRPGDRIKNDRRDSARLAELLRAGELTPIWIPDEEHVGQMVWAREN
jgi:transposase